LSARSRPPKFWLIFRQSLSQRRQLSIGKKTKSPDELRIGPSSAVIRGGSLSALDRQNINSILNQTQYQWDPIYSLEIINYVRTPLACLRLLRLPVMSIFKFWRRNAPADPVENRETVRLTEEQLNSLERPIDPAPLRRRTVLPNPKPEPPKRGRTLICPL